MASSAILSNFFEEQRTQNPQQYVSWLLRTLFPTTFLEIAVSIILKLKGFVKRHLISRIVKVDQNVYRTANFSASIHTCTNQILLSSNPLELSPWSVRHILKTIETMWWTCMWKVFRSFSTDNGRTSRWSIVNRISNHHPKISRWCSYRFHVNFTNIEVAIGEKSSRERFWKNSSSAKRYRCKSNMASFRCYDNSGVIATLILTNFHLYYNTTVLAIFQISKAT